MFHKYALLVAALALVAAACASSPDAAEAPPSTLAATSTSTTQATTSTTVAATTTTVDDGFPVTIDAPNGQVTIEERPTRIVSISPTSTEVLFAIGAGDQVVAVDSLSNYPPEAPLTDLSAFSPSVEAIAAYDPDLVVLSFDPDGGLLPALEAIGVPAILHAGPATVDGAYAQWEQLGVATGNIAEAVGVVAETSSLIDEAYATVPAAAEGQSYYWELDPTLYSLTSATFVGDLLLETKMTNIADDADADGYGYPQLTSEYVIGANPDLIVLADTLCCGQSATTVAERPGWNTMTAVASEQIVELNDDIASRWGPRIAVLVEDVVAAILEFVPADA
ncbi:MAG: ABC transporter substrate-binding protein [Acidimicrobiia bacterium]